MPGQLIFNFRVLRVTISEISPICLVFTPLEIKYQWALQNNNNNNNNNNNVVKEFRRNAAALICRPLRVRVRIDSSDLVAHLTHCESVPRLP